jgi:hypothetical protein
VGGVIDLEVKKVFDPTKVDDPDLKSAKLDF